jgi:FdhD protein
VPSHSGSPPRDSSVSALVVRRDGATSEWKRDALVAEEPLEVRLREDRDGDGVRFVVTMRTPGDDEDLAMGLLYGEGVIDSASEVVALERPSDPRIAAELARNVIVATLAPRPGRHDRVPRRATVMGSACGVCGRTSIEDVVKLAQASRRTSSPGAASDDVAISVAVLISLPEKLKQRQSVFASTGGLHAAGLFEADGTLVVAREDVGRHNATDKVVGALLRAGRAAPPVLLVSGRLGFEIAQKAALAGVRIVAAVSAPTSLAVDLAEETGLTLVGFLRGERFNVYTRPERIGSI